MKYRVHYEGGAGDHGLGGAGVRDCDNLDDLVSWLLVYSRGRVPLTIHKVEELGDEGEEAEGEG